MDEIKDFLKNRPEVKGAYGYGSGVFKQSGYTDKDKPQIDLILVVDNLKEWHLKNMKMNKNDYSLTGRLYYKLAKNYTLRKQTGIVYLSNISFNNSIYKYGTIEERDLIRYLITWDSFYLPGRFQKNILPIIKNDRVEKANMDNRNYALYTSLLTIKEEKQKLIDIYTQLCGLSYLGDTRMKFAENPRKVLNIVEGSYDEFLNIYGNHNEYFKTNKDGIVTIDYDKVFSDANIYTLPEALYDYIKHALSSKDHEVIRNKILEYFTLLNKKESTTQTIKGLYTNGLTRSVKYASSKVLKKIKH